MTDEIRVEIDAVAVGKAFAHSDDHRQAALLNALGRELRVCIRDEHKVEMQLCYISDKLDVNGAYLISQLAEFVTLREKTTP